MFPHVIERVGEKAPETLSRRRGSGLLLPTAKRGGRTPRPCWTHRPLACGGSPRPCVSPHTAGCPRSCYLPLTNKQYCPWGQFQALVCLSQHTVPCLLSRHTACCPVGTAGAPVFLQSQYTAAALWEQPQALSALGTLTHRPAALWGQPQALPSL